MTTRVRVLTFNIWALPVSLPGARRRHRIKQMPEAIARLDPDLIALQEAFAPWARQHLVHALREKYHAQPTAYAARRALGLVKFDTTGGLLNLSRHEVTYEEFFPFSDRPSNIEERLARKGLLVTVLETPAGELAFVNLHFCAGPSETSVRARVQQYDALNRVLDQLPQSMPVILAGDFNAFVGKTRRNAHIELSREIAPVLEAGFLDASRPTTDAEIPVTYAVPHNKYTRLPYNRTKAVERFDYIFYRNAPGFDIAVEASDVQFNHLSEPLSDHYGLAADLRL